VTNTSVSTWLWRVLLSLTALVVVWRIMVTGVVEYLTDGSEPASAERVLSWNDSHPKALYLAAREALERDPRGAAEMARRAYASDPTDPRPLLLLASIRRDQGQVASADRLAGWVAVLRPADVQVLVALADYWERGGRLDRALQALGGALEVDPGLGRELFPLLLKLAEEPATRELFEPLAAAPPPWWDGFFAHVAQRSVRLETLGALLTLRRTSAVPLSAAERDAAVARMQREREWPAAYLLWVNGLSAEQRRWLGSVYNGSFELETTGRGFDWRIRNAKGVKVARQPTYGIRDKLALHLVFEGRELIFRHLYQPLFLGPGNYELRLLGRPDRLQGRGGLVWRIRCEEEPDRLLGTSDRFLGTSEWRMSRVSFDVPADACAAQILLLESMGDNPYDHKLEGEVWFDQLVVRRLHAP
jgi:tetratricopeptide (TPR) repeat protein